MNKQQLLEHLKTEVYCRLKPGKYGVGVFAIRDIPKGVNPFPDCDNEVVMISPKEIQNLDEGVKKMIRDFCALDEGNYCVPDFGLNRINASFYFNHSTEPNMSTEDGWIFITKREITKGEELTVDYRQYYEEIVKEFSDEDL
ncbi:MAG TPA: SET domain-containing protein [Candidatus Nitrosocosmicus sp.]|nr:SET domain-containing protein [Candidatus Nitrosocosmicus sp.]